MMFETSNAVTGCGCGHGHDRVVHTESNSTIPQTVGYATDRPEIDLNPICSTQQLGYATSGAIPQTVPPAPNRMRDVLIHQLDYGYLVTIGCQSFAFEDFETIIGHLSAYMENPTEVEKDWLGNHNLPC